MKKITKKRTVYYEVFVAYDGTEFSAEAFSSIDEAKKQCEKYEHSTVNIVVSKAMKLLKPYVVPGFEKLNFEALPEDIKNNVVDWRKKLYTADKLTVYCIASSLLTGNYGSFVDNADNVYVFKPTKQSDIDIVVQYCELIKCPIYTYDYNSKDYGEALAQILKHYSVELTSLDSIKVGHTYLVTTVSGLEFTSVIEIESVVNLLSELLKDVKENY